MKVSAKRRRTKEEVKEQKRVESNAQAELARRLAQIQELERANDELQQNLSDTEHVRQQVQSFIDDGQLDMDPASGRVSVVNDPARRAELQEQSAQRRASISTEVIGNAVDNRIMDPGQMDEGVNLGQAAVQNNQ